MMHKSALDYVLLVTLAAIFGSAFAFIKLVGATLDPLWLATLRTTMGGLALLLIALVRKSPWPRGWRVWGSLLGLGMLGTGLPFFLVAWGEHYVDSSLAAIIMGLIPLGVLVIAHFFTHDEKWRLGQALAVSLGLAGIFTLVGWDALKGVGEHLLGEGIIFLAVLSLSSYAVAAKRLPELPPETTVGGMLLAASAVMIPVAAIWSHLPAFAPGWVGGMLWLGVACTGIGNFLFVHLLRRSGANFVSLSNYLIPVVGLFLGAMTLGERPGPGAYGAMALIFTGLLLPRLTRAGGMARHAEPLGSSKEKSGES
ncbi:MAG TPA: DMT family transporter [Dongiaceae bacterium]|nr:DMT family transporter [Dongiaceae bacterium]